MSSLRAGSAAAVDDDADAVARSRSVAGAAVRTTNRERWRSAPTVKAAGARMSPRHTPTRIDDATRAAPNAVGAVGSSADALTAVAPLT